MPGFGGGNLSNLRPGDRVRVVSGYFKNEEGVVQTADADGRAVVQIQRGEGAFKARFQPMQIERVTGTSAPTTTEPVNPEPGEGEPVESD